LPKELLPRLSWATEQRGTRRYVRYHARLRPDLGAFADPQMPGHCPLAADLDEVLQHGGARNANLRYNNATPAEANIVGDLDQIIEPRAHPDHRVPGRASVDGGVSADLHVVL
jgi:hypothetical protein